VSGDIFAYSFTVSNPSSNTGSVWLFGIEIQKPSGGVVLSGDGLVNDSGYFVNTSQQILKESGDALIPVGLQTPPNWDSGLSQAGRADWTASDAAYFIRPGASSGGFQLSSRGLPGIRTATVQAYLDVDTLPIAPPANAADIGRYAADLAALQSKATVKVVTIGPTAPPITFNAPNFLATIISYKEQAFQHGWIRGNGIGISLDAKLNASSASLARDDNKTAANVLNALLNEVDAQAGKQLSPEAAALLKFNTQYLISKIQ
jgi:hypothetical protein